MVRALKWPRPGVGGRRPGLPEGLTPRASDRRAAGSIRRCPDGWLPRVRQDFMLQDLMLEVLPPCYERRRIFHRSAAVKTQRPIFRTMSTSYQFRPRTSAHPPGGRNRPGQAPQIAGGERSVPLRAAARRGRRFPSSHARQCRRARVHRGADRHRHLACGQYRRSAQDPGLRADGPPRLRRIWVTPQG